MDPVNVAGIMILLGIVAIFAVTWLRGLRSKSGTDRFLFQTWLR